MHTLSPPRYDAPIGRTADGRPVMGERAFLDFVLQALFLRVGGAVAMTNTELADGLNGSSSGPPPVAVGPAAADDLAPPPAVAVAPEEFADGRLQALEAEMHRLQGLINDLQQGRTS